MKVIESVAQMQEESESLRRAGNVISLVPTMGFLHKGHLELMRVAKEHSDKMVMSLFINPTQFGPSEDFEAYPRDTEGDLEKAQSIGADVVFMPVVEEMYPESSQTSVRVERVTRHLCGLSRLGHFDGVTTVVTKLFNCTKPHVAVFGQKDYQQLAVIRRMVMDLDMDIRIIGVPIVREPDGLAMSSRNSYLDPDERTSALCLKKSLELAEKMYYEGTTDAGRIKAAVALLIQSQALIDIDYISLCDPVTLEETKTLRDETLLALAVRVGQTRLIDNCLIRKRGKISKP